MVTGTAMVGLGVEICKGSELFTKLAQPEFLEEWRRLYESCPWATVGQHPQFVAAWCRVYGSQRAPLLVIGRSLTGEMVGLLALERVGKVFQHVAVDDCEYHVWLAAPEQGDTFMPAVIQALDETFGSARVELRYMPPTTPRAWLSHGDGVAARCEESVTERRVLRVNNPELVRQYVRDKSRLRTTMNKFKRSGAVQFRRVRGRHEVAMVLRACEPMFDFRKGAAYGHLPFRDDPLRRPFLLAQAEEADLLHVVVLERDEQIVAAHIGPAGKRELSVAGLVHNEFESRYSPGSLLLLELIQLLSLEGFDTLDFTPGDNEYKSRFANETEPVYTLTVHASRLGREARRARAMLKRAARSTLARFPEPMQARAKKMPSDIRNMLRVLRVDGKATPNGHSAGLASTALQFQPSFLVPPSSTGVSNWKRNSLEELALHAGARETYLEFLRATVAQVRAGAAVYTRSWERTLQAVCYLAPGRAFKSSAPLAEGASVLHGLTYFGSPPSVDEQRAWIVELLSSLEPAVRAQLFAVVPDAETQKLLEALGFQTLAGVAITPGEPHANRKPEEANQPEG